MIELKDFKALKENNEDKNEIIISENISLAEPFILEPGATLKGKNSIQISGENQLIGLTKNNSIKDITLTTNKDKDAIFLSIIVYGVTKLYDIIFEKNSHRRFNFRFSYFNFF